MPQDPELTCPHCGSNDVDEDEHCNNCDLYPTDEADDEGYEDSYHQTED